MDNSMAVGTSDSGISRKKFFAFSGMGVLATGLMPNKSLALATRTSNVTTASSGAYLSKSFVGTLDQLGKMMFPHELGASLPANLLSVSAFIRLPDGKVRNISVQHVDATSISIVGGVPNAAVKVGVVYSKDDASW